MLDNHRFTLLIIGVGVGALPASNHAAYHKEAEVLTGKLAVLLEDTNRQYRRSKSGSQ